MPIQGTTPDSVLARRLAQDVTRTDTCWLWTAALDRHHYGYIQGQILGFRRHIRAHIVAYALASGAPIPPGAFVCHTCDVRYCVRNDDAGVYTVRGVDYPRFGHLWLGTPAANTADMVDKGRYRGAHAGSRHHFARLTEDDVRTISAWYSRGLAHQYELARLFGVAQSQIGRITRGERWQHLGLTAVRGERQRGARKGDRKRAPGTATRLTEGAMS